MSSTSKRLRWSFAVVLAVWMYAGQEAHLQATPYYCDQICYWPNTSCDEPCIDPSGYYMSTCGAYGQYECIPGGPLHCLPYYEGWQYSYSVAFRNVTVWDGTHGHYDCYQETLAVIVNPETNCENTPDAYSCASGEVAGTRQHNVYDCDPYYAESGTWSCPV